MSVEEGKNAKLICEKVVPFSEGTKEVWIRFRDMAEYEQKKEQLLRLIGLSEGKDEVILYLAAERAIKRLGAGQGIRADGLIEELKQSFGSENIQIKGKKLAI